MTASGKAESGHFSPSIVCGSMLEILQHFDGQPTAEAIATVASSDNITPRKNLVRKLSDFALRIPAEVANKQSWPKSGTAHMLGGAVLLGQTLQPSAISLPLQPGLATAGSGEAENRDLLTTSSDTFREEAQTKMKLSNLMLLALIAPLAQPVVAKPAVTYGLDAVAQTSGGSTGGGSTDDTQKKKKDKKDKNTQESKQKHGESSTSEKTNTSKKTNTSDRTNGSEGMKQSR